MALPTKTKSKRGDKSAPPDHPPPPAPHIIDKSVKKVSETIKSSKPSGPPINPFLGKAKVMENRPEDQMEVEAEFHHRISGVRNVLYAGQKLSQLLQYRSDFLAHRSFKM